MTTLAPTIPFDSISAVFLASVLALHVLPAGSREGPVNDGRTRLAACTDAEAWLLVSRRAPGSTETSGLVVRVARNGERDERPTGNGWISSYGRVPGGGESMVLVKALGEHSPSHLLSRRPNETEGGASRPLPDGVRGIAFASVDRGWAWSADAVYRTGDGGSTWRAWPAKGWKLESGWSPGQPRLEEDRLWIPLSHGGQAPGAKVVVLEGDSSAREVAAWSDESIAGLAHNGGEPVVVLRSWGREHFRVVRLEPTSEGRWRQVELFTRTGASPLGIEATSQGIVIAAGEGEWPGSFFGRIKTSIWTSTDRGATWRRRTDEASSWCAANGGYWSAPGRGEHALFTPWEH